MSVQTDPLPPVPEHTPPVQEDAVRPTSDKFFNQIWTRWFTSLREKVNVISQSLVNLGDFSGAGVVTKNGDDWGVEPMERLLPSGGVTGQVLAKTTGANYNVGWVNQSGGGGGGWDPRTSQEIFFQLRAGFPNSTTSTSFVYANDFTNHHSGSGAGYSSGLNSRGVAAVVMTTGSTSSGWARFVGLPRWTMATGTLTLDVSYELPIASDGTNEYNSVIGFTNVVTGTTNAIFFGVVNMLSSNIGLYTLTGSGYTILDTTSVPLPAGTEFLLRLVISADGSTVDGYLDNVLIVSGTPTGFPMGSAVYAPTCQMNKTSGTAARQSILSYMKVKCDFNVPGPA